MSGAIGLLVLVPLLGAVGALATTGRVAHRVGVLTAFATTVLSGVLAQAVATGGTLDLAVGGWPSALGIALRLDALSALLVVVASLTVLAVLVATGTHGDEDRVPVAPTLHLVLLAGVLLAFVTADLFTLFVAFELTLVTSYVLLVGSARVQNLRAAGPYVVTNLLAGALFLLAVAAVYATVGSVNLDVVAARWPAVPTPVASAIATLLLVVFAVKAAAFPFFAWLPRSYPAAPTVVAALFAGLLTKVGVYALLRTRPILFQGEGADTLLLVIACATMLVGVLGALGQSDIRNVLSFHIVSQVGYMLLGLALLDLAGVAGAVLYLVHHIVVKTGLFLVGFRIEELTGTTRLGGLGGLARSAPATATLFAVLALSLAGLPPTSGFVAKYALIRAAIEAGQPLAAAVAVVVGLLTLLSMTKIWLQAFWSDGAAPQAREPRRGLGPAATMVAASVAVAAFAGPLHGIARDAATTVLDPVRPEATT